MSVCVRVFACVHVCGVTVSLCVWWGGGGYMDIEGNRQR